MHLFKPSDQIPEISKFKNMQYIIPHMRVRAYVHLYVEDDFLQSTSVTRAGHTASKVSEGRPL